MRFGGFARGTWTAGGVEVAELGHTPSAYLNPYGPRVDREYIAAGTRGCWELLGVVGIHAGSIVVRTWATAMACSGAIAELASSLMPDMDIVGARIGVAGPCRTRRVGKGKQAWSHTVTEECKLAVRIVVEEAAAYKSSDTAGSGLVKMCDVKAVVVAV